LHTWSLAVEEQVLFFISFITYFSPNLLFI
jgi:peptidoglycan/LPS O-acetylase OafA/YrhL